MAEVTITVFDNGPVEIVGPVKIQDENGNTILFAEGEPIYFCRCGQSDDKPFCDGSHDDCGFQSKMTK